MVNIKRSGSRRDPGSRRTGSQRHKRRQKRSALPVVIISGILLLTACGIAYRANSANTLATANTAPAAATSDESAPTAGDTPIATSSAASAPEDTTMPQQAEPVVRHDAGTPFDLQGFIDQELQSGKQRIVIPPGRHRVTPKDKIHLILEDLSDIEIDATGAEMVCTETTRALRINNCTNVTLRGLTIDYDPLPYTQGRIVSLSQDNTVHDIELFEGYPAAQYVDEFKYEIFKPDTRTLRFGSYHSFKVEPTGERTIRVTREGNYRGEQVGDIIAIGTRIASGGQIPHAVTVNDSTNVVLEDIHLYASNCFGFLEGGCTATVYRRCVIDRRAPEDDLKPREDARIRSLDADAYHSKTAIVGPQIIECTAKFQADDCINICGNYHMVMASEGATLRVLAKHKLDIQIGDPLEVVAYDGQRLPDAKALAIKKIGTLTDDERQFLSTQRMHRPFREGSIKDIYEVVIDRPVALERGSVIGAANRMGNGFKVIGCDFGFNRSRGILIKASHGEVSGNTLEGCEGQAIKVAPEWWWLESGSSNDITISGNTIRNCGGDGIAVYAEAGKGGKAPAGAHNDIRITNNTMSNVDGRDIYVSSTKGLVLTGNNCDADSIVLENCEDITRD